MIGNKFFEKYNGTWVILTGLGEFNATDGCNGINGWYFEINGKIYHTYEDPCDSYRSYSIIEEGYYQGWDMNNECYVDVKSNNMTFIPPQPLKVKTEDGYSDSNYYKFWKVSFYNDCDELVLEIGTENYDDYYPYAILHWHPENLPINKTRK